MRTLRHAPGVAGLDEAGRGPLAGPVVAAAVALPEGFPLAGIDDSKRLSARARAEAAARIREGARFATARLEAPVVDELNVLWASMAAMEAAAAALEEAGLRFLVDGDRVPRGLAGRAEAVIGGDGVWACIAAASILAKTERDAIMTAHAQAYPEYGFERHFGYATAEHLAALERHGPCPLHRRSFAPVAQLRLFAEPLGGAG